MGRGRSRLSCRLPPVPSRSWLAKTGYEVLVHIIIEGPRGLMDELLYYYQRLCIEVGDLDRKQHLRSAFSREQQGFRDHYSIIAGSSGITSVPNVPNFLLVSQTCQANVDSYHAAAT